MQYLTSFYDNIDNVQLLLRLPLYAALIYSVYAFKGQRLLFGIAILAVLGKSVL
jgi:hypothetical protein